MEGRGLAHPWTLHPAIRIDVLEVFVELLAQVEDDASSDAFYSRLCEATCALTSMDRAVIFRYDEVRRRVRAAGAYGIDSRLFADAHVTVESAPVAASRSRRTASSRSTRHGPTRCRRSSGSWCASPTSSARRSPPRVAGSA